jgi:hypothetical protein
MMIVEMGPSLSPQILPQCGVQFHQWRVTPAVSLPGAKGCLQANTRDPLADSHVSF